MTTSLRILCLILIGVSAALAQIRVPFLETPPVIDGQPDSALLRSIEPVRLHECRKSRPDNPDVTVNLRMAYGTEFLYLLLETDADTLICRDRAYQNGDGFHLTLARPMPGNAPTDEFYVLRFSPGDTATKREARLGVWHYNIDLQGTRLGPRSRMATFASHNRVWHEAVVAWRDIPPYHPFAGAIGLNLCYVKAVGAADKNNYFLVHDKRMQSEGSRRLYMVPRFSAPRSVTRTQAFASVTHPTITEGSTDTLIVNYVSPRASTRTVTTRISGTTADTLVIDRTRIALRKGPGSLRLPIPSRVLTEGEHRIHVSIAGADSVNAVSVTVLPSIDLDSLRGAIAHSTIREGTRTTIAFRIEEAARRIRQARPYENLPSLLGALRELRALAGACAQGDDPIASARGVLRRAFFSRVDSSLRPYSVKMPRSFDPRKRYPLLVFLHGSGEDDSRILTYMDLTNGEWIELAPNGRGVSNCFTTDHAQEDIAEAVEDCLNNYPIDSSRIVIAGFSMGGYGAYRTFYEHPEKYCGVAVLSGHPNLASKWIGEGHPDFLDPSVLPSFKNIPMFIYHSENDSNCPDELTRSAIARLAAAGARLDTAISSDAGHSIIDPESRKSFLQWLAARAGAK